MDLTYLEYDNHGVQSRCQVPQLNISMKQFGCGTCPLACAGLCGNYSLKHRVAFSKVTTLLNQLPTPVMHICLNIGCIDCSSNRQYPTSTVGRCKSFCIHFICQWLFSSQKTIGHADLILKNLDYRMPTTTPPTPLNDAHQGGFYLAGQQVEIQ